MNHPMRFLLYVLLLTGPKTAPDNSPLVWNAGNRQALQFEGGSKQGGWKVSVEKEIDIGGAQIMRAEIDQGRNKIVVPRAQGISSTRGFAGKTSEGTDVILRIYLGACSDGMTNQIYAARTTLTVGEQTYAGCGRFLNE